MFTALAVMQLRDHGKIRLTDTLVRYFPDIPEYTFLATATVGQLLSHTSGLGDYLDDKYREVWDSISSLKQVIPFVYDDSISFRPGTGFQYSNSGFILAGLIVETVSGGDYFDYIRTHVYQPLGMTQTDSYEMHDADTSLAERLRRSDTGWLRAPHGLRGTSAGGGFSTPRDMLKFALGLKAGRILSLASLNEMTRPKNSKFDSAYPYGSGFELTFRHNKLESFGHGGQAPGVNFDFRYFPDEELTMVVFCNQDNGAFDDLRRNVTRLITGNR
jgi:CubicO group peptidase (beta-lactamase class C family)